MEFTRNYLSINYFILKLFFSLKMHFKQTSTNLKNIFKFKLHPVMIPVRTQILYIRAGSYTLAYNRNRSSGSILLLVSEQIIQFGLYPTLDFNFPNKYPPHTQTFPIINVQLSITIFYLISRDSVVQHMLPVTMNSVWWRYYQINVSMAPAD